MLVAAALGLAGCATMGPPMGLLYTGMGLPSTATGRYEQVSTQRSGSATCTGILWLVATGDCSQDAAMKAGRITKVHHVDQQSTSVLGIYQTFTTIVYGE